MIEYSYKTIQSLRYAKYRKNYNKFVIEGKRLIKSALESKINIGPLLCSERFIKENKEWLKKNVKDKSIIKIISEKQSIKISNTKSPSGILTICDIPKKISLNLNVNKWVYIDKISDPGNMGTLIRTCAWFGINNIALSPGCADPYNPKSIRSAMGAHFIIYRC
jgi:TrmH family RNA methyltransferase